jgi:hypothetical protein
MKVQKIILNKLLNNKNKMKKLKLKFVTWLLKEYEVKLNFAIHDNHIGSITNVSMGVIECQTLILDTIKIDGKIQISINPKNK